MLCDQKFVYFSCINEQLKYAEIYSFPGLVRGRRERAWYTLFVHAQFPLYFREFGNFHKICSITLMSVRLIPYKRCPQLTMASSP